MAVKKVEHLNVCGLPRRRMLRLCQCPGGQKNIQEVLHKDVRLLNEDWASKFIAEAVKHKADAALIVGGFPCKDLSRQQNQEHRKNLQGKYSGLFYEIPRSTGNSW